MGNGYKQVPQMSSEQFLKLDSSFVAYKHKPVSAAAKPPAGPTGSGHYGPSAPLTPKPPSAPPSPSSRKPRKRAVTIGINYIGLQCQLAGCINDSDTFVNLLEQDFGYAVTDIRQLRDDRP